MSNLKTSAYVIAFFTLLLIISCSHEKQSYSNYISFPDDMNLYEYGYKNYKGVNSKCKLLISYDSLVCGPCAVTKLYTYKDILAYVEQFDNEASVVFILSPKKKDIEIMTLGISSNPIEYPIYYDIKNSFKSMNKLPDGLLICLLDSTNKIVYYGNPFDETIWNHYKDSISKYTLY